jgi:predicted dienelactone hydrolase
MKRFLFTCVASLFAVAVQASMGVTELPGVNGDGPVTVFYPSSSTAAPVQRGPFTLDAAQQGKPVAGNKRLVVFSHGSGGAPWVHSDLARAFVDAGFMVAMPEHQGDNWHDMDKVGPPSWKQRPGEVSRAIDAVLRDARFAPLLDANRVGVYGMSAGGHTALTFAGGRWSPSVLRQYCAAHLEDDFPSCVGLRSRLNGDMLDGVKKTVARFLIDRRLDDSAWYSHADARVKAVVAEVPFAADFDMASLAAPRVPLGIVRNGKDLWLAPHAHASAVLKACTSCELVADLPAAGHGSLLSPQPIGLTGYAAELLGDPPGFDRALVGPAHAQIVAFFRKRLLP